MTSTTAPSREPPSRLTLPLSGLRATSAGSSPGLPPSGPPPFPPPSPALTWHASNSAARANDDTASTTRFADMAFPLGGQANPERLGSDRGPVSPQRSPPDDAERHATSEPDPFRHNIGGSKSGSGLARHEHFNIA